MGQASITVDILAKVKGWQEELTKLKASASKIDLGSDFGKSFSRNLSNLESQVNNMARNITHKLTSESGIDSFITKMGNIDTQFESLGTRLAGITFDSLDPSYITEELKELNEQLVEAQASLDIKVGEGFNEAVMQSTTLQNALERLGENPATITLQQAGEVLAAGIEKMKGKVIEADEELKRLSGSLSEVRAEAKTLSEEPIAALDDLKAKAQELAGSQGDYGFKTVNLTAINQWIATTRASLLAAGTDLSDDSNAINQALTKLADSKTRDEVQTNLVALKAALSDSKVKISLGDIGLGNIQSQTNKFIHDDLAALDNAKTALQSKLLELKIPQEQVDSIVFDFTELVKKGNWEQAIALLESNLETYKSTIEQKTAEIKAKEESLVGQIGVTKSVRRNAIATQTSAEKALSGDYQQIVKDLQSKNADLEARVKELESIIKGKQSEILGKVQGTGKGISKESQTQFEQNAAAARMYKDELAQVQSREQLIGKIQGVVQRWFSIYAAVRMVSNAIKSVISTIKELDATITEIAIVTKMSQNDLWNQMDSYTALARKYASSISGVYKVSQLYYQQGLGQDDVMALTEQTLKMARISGLDYAEATDYMTNAVRSFKMEMTDAQTVVDTYSAIAAKSATNVTELATAMSKTASSAESVGSSFQNTTAMMAVMIEATRESAENIGSAMKSIISRYGELKENKTGIDSEGEEYSLNKVDTALQSVGLSIHDANGEFREFDDVIMELAEKWNTIDKNTQRYIATVMAGNRQQSRFLALVSSYDRLKELSAEAADSEDAAQLQFLKTLDSVDAKTQQLQTSLQSLYVNSGLENLYKGILDIANNIIQSFTEMPTLFELPIPAIAKFGLAFASLANVVTTLFGVIKSKISANVKAISGEVAAGNENTVAASNSSYQQDVANYRAAAQERVRIEEQTQQQIRQLKQGGTVDPSQIGARTKNTGSTTGTGAGKVKGVSRGWAIGGVAMSLGGLALSGIADNMDAKTQGERNWKGVLTAGGSALQGAGIGASIGGGYGAAIGGVIGLATGALQAFGIIHQTTEEKIQDINDDIEKSNNERIKAKDDLKTLTEYKKKYDEASKNRYLDASHEQEWKDLNNEIVAAYPELLGYIDAEGNAVANLADAYDALYGKKKDAYEAAVLENMQANLTGFADMEYSMQNTISAMSNLYLSKDHGTRIFGKAGSLANLTFGLTKPTEAEGNAKADEIVEGILRAMTASNGNWDAFVSGVGRETGLDYVDYFSGGNFTTLWGADVLGDAQIEYIQAVLEHIETNFTEYFERIDEYVESQFGTINELYGEGTQYSEYSFMSDQVSDLYVSKWEEVKEQALAEGKNISQAWAIFWQQIPTLIEQWDTILFQDNPATKSLEEAEKIWTNRGQYSSDFFQNIEHEIPEEVYQLFKPEQIEELKQEAEKKMLTAITSAKTTLASALDDGFISPADNTKVQESIQEFGRQLYYVPLDFIDSFSQQYNNLLTSSNYSQSGRIEAIDKFSSILDTIKNADINDQLKNQAYSLMSNADFSSIYSLTELQQGLKDLGIEVDFSDLIDTIIPNINTEINNYTNSLSEGFSKLEEAMKKASKGMSLSDAIKMVEEFGLSLTDFEQKGDKFYLKDLSKLSEATSKLNPEYEANLQAALDAKKQQYAELNNWDYEYVKASTEKFDFSKFKAMDEEAAEEYYSHFQDSFAEHQISKEQLWQWKNDPAYQNIIFSNGGVRSNDSIISSGNFSLASIMKEAKYDYNAIEESIKLHEEELTASGVNVAELLTDVKRYIDNGDFTIPFEDWIIAQLESDAQVVSDATRKAEQYVIGSTYLSQGNLNGFLDTVAKPLSTYTDEILQAMIQENGGREEQGFRERAAEIAQAERNKVIAAIQSGNLEEVLAADKNLYDWADELYSIYGEINKQVYESLASSFKSGKYITSTDVNDYKFEELVNKGLVKKIGDHLYEVIGDYQAVVDEITNSDLDEDTKAAQLKTLFEDHHKDQISPISSLLDKEGVSYDEAEKFAESLGRNASEAQAVMEEYGFKLNSLTGRYEATATTLQMLRDHIAELEAKPDADQEELNKLRAMVDDLEKQEKRKTTAAAFTDVFSNYDKITTESAAALATALGTTYEDVVQTYLIDNGNGTFSLDMSKVQSLLQSGRAIIGDALYNELLDQVAEFYDDGLTAIADASSFVSKGTDKATDMQKFVTDFNKKTGSDFSISDMFQWDDVLETYTLKPQYLQEYLDAQRAELKEQGFDDEFIEKYIDKQVEDIRNAVNISDFYSAEVRGQGSKARRTLESAMKASLAAQEEFETENYDYYLKIAESEVGANTVEARYVADAYLADAQARNAARQAVIDSQVADDIAALEAGGQAAIDVMRKYAEDGELTVDQVEQAYKQRFTNLSNVMEALDGLQKNSVVDATTRDILNQIPGFKVNSDGVVEEVGNLVTAYTELYKQMKSTTVATTSELNAAYAKVLTAGEQKDIDAVDALENAMGMTYDALGEMLGKYNKDLETIMNSPDIYGIEQIGAGKIRIKDFSKFAGEMGWEAGSEEYTSAFKTYNDSLIEYNKHVGTEIKGEFDALLEAKPNEQVNLTRLTSTYGENAIAEVLKDFDVTLKDGILTLGQNADIPGVAEALGKYVVDSGGMLQTELEATLDQASKQNQMDLVSAYTDIVQNYNSISMETIAKFAKGMGKNYQSVIDALGLDDSDNDGVYKMNLSALKSVVDMGAEYVGQETYNQLLEIVAGVQDNILSSISTAAGYTQSGTTSMSDMQKFVNELNTLTGSSIGIGQAFEYDTVLNTFKLNSSTLKTYIAAQKAELEKLGMSGEAIDEYINDQTINMLQANINVEDFLSATSTGAKSEAAAKLGQEIKDWYEAQGTAITDAEIEAILRTLDAGGNDAVAKLKEIKGTNVSTAELEAAYNASINRLRTAAEDLTKGVGETVSGEAIAIMRAANFELDSLEDGTAVITAVGDMVAAYSALYAQMESNAQHTTADLNQTFAQLLGEADKNRTTALETLQNASGMTYEAFGELLTQYDINFKDVMADATKWGVRADGYGNIQITSWADFVEQMNANGANWDPNDPALASAYSDWNDARAEMANKPAEIVQAAADELSSLTEATPGQAVNVSYLQKAMGGRLDAWVQEYGQKYGVQLDEGLLLLGDNVNIPGLITAIANEAAAAGAAIPEELAKLADAVADMLASITSLLTGGINGTLSNEDALSLQKWADSRDMGMELQFTRTKDGLQLATDQAIKLVAEMRKVDALQGEIAFQSLKDNLIETDDRFKSASTNASHIAETEREIARLTREETNYAKAKQEYNIASSGGRAPKIDAFESLNGNTNMYNRPWIENSDGSHSTVLSTQYDETVGEQEVHVLMTPIPEWAEVESDVLDTEQLDGYLDGLMAENPIDVDALLKLDAEGLDVELDGVSKHVSNMIMDVKDATETSQAAMDDEANALHEWSDAWESVRNDVEAPDNSARIEALEEELALAKEIQMVRGTSEDDSFKFMEQDIPAAQNNPLNYWNNWVTAYNAIQDSISGGEGKTGYMDYSNFYNLVTEMGNLAEMTGQAIPLGETVLSNAEDAADLITRAAGALEVTSDGSLKINLEGIGVDFQSSAEGMADSVDAGIHAVAQSQIDMLDGLISLLETIVAMESLGDIDVEGNGIDLTDIFTVEYDENGAVKAITGFTDKYAEWRETILDQITEGSDNFNKDLADAMSKITIDGNSLADMINWDWSDFNPDSAQTFSTTMAALYQAAISNNYDLDNIAESVKEVLIASGLNNVAVDIGDTSLVIAGGQVTQINWKTADSQSVMDQVRNSCEEYKNKTDAEIHKIITTTMQKYQNGEVLSQEELEWTVEMNHHLKIVDGKKQVTWNNKTYGEGEAGYEAALAAWRLQDTEGVELDRDLTQEEIDSGTVTTTATIGNKTDIKVTSDGTTMSWHSDVTGEDYTSQDALLKGEYAKYIEDHPVAEGEQQVKYESWLFAEYGIRVKVQTSFTGEDGKPVDLTTDTETRQKVKDLMASSESDIKAMVEAGADGQGNYEVTLDNGVTITFSGDDVTVDGEVDPDLVRQQMASALGLDQSLADTITLGIQNAFGEGGIPLENLKITPSTTTVDGEITVEPIDTATGEVVNLKVTAQNTEAEGTITDAEISAMLESATVSVSVDKETAIADLQEIATEASTVEASDPTVEAKETETPNGIAGKLKDIWQNADKVNGTRTATVKLTGETAFKSAIDSLIEKCKELAKTWNVTFNAKKTGTWPAKANGWIAATGNVGRAMAGGGTLMGELGPELVVQKGRYFLAGQSGAEFVDLAPDAIVFNHLQTEQLMTKGMSTERGRAITNERTAVAFAKGNWDGGDAMASASAALAALKQLRSMWQSLLNASVTDLAGAGGGGGGGGGGSDGTDYGNFIKELEKWYNWLQKIAELEEQINYQETLRSKIQSDMIPHGQDITKSYLTSLKALQDEVAVQESLMNAQQDYFNSRLEWMNSKQNPFSALYTFDDNGQLQYTKDENGVSALEEFSKMVGTNEQGRANMTAEEQYKKLVEMGYGDYLKYDSEGKEIDFSTDDEGNLNDENAYTTAVQAFWDKIDADKEEMQSLHDSINEHRDAMLEKQEAMNEIMKAIEDNQISVENKVLKAVEDSRQREIDALQDQRDAIEDAANNLIDGLSKQLQDERDMYADQESANELARLQRQLAILQRSGGSASQIASLQSQISDKMQNAYFDAQQEQIDALQEAADTQLEKLDEQIDLMEEQLAYEKEHGMLWAQVYEVMQGSPEEIAQYIQDNDSSFWSESPTKSSQSFREALYEAQQYTEFRDSVEGGLDALVKKFTDTTGDTEGAEGPQQSEDEGGGGSDDSGDQGDQGSSDLKKFKAHLYATNGNGENKENLGVFKVEAKDETAAIAAIKSQANAKIDNLNKDKEKKDKYTKLTDEYIKSKIKAYKRGGLITETGYIKVHGSEEEPEGILSSTDTQAMQDFWAKLNHDYDILEEIYEVFQELKKRALGEEEPVAEEVPVSAVEQLYRLTKIPIEELEQMSEKQLERMKKEFGIEDTDTQEQAEEAEEAQKTYKETIESFQESMRTQKEEMWKLHTSYIQADLDTLASTGSNYENIRSGRDTIIIEQASVNMNVEKMNNDYDASRAGEQAMEQMLKIARKSQGWNRVGR